MLARQIGFVYEQTHNRQHNTAALSYKNLFALAVTRQCNFEIEMGYLNLSTVNKFVVRAKTTKKNERLTSSGPGTTQNQERLLSFTIFLLFFENVSARHKQTKLQTPRPSHPTVPQAAERTLAAGIFDPLQARRRPRAC